MGIHIDDPATPSSAAPLSLGRFIIDNMEGILQDWQEYAQSLFPDEVLSKKTLRDHAKQLLEAIAADISQPQSSGTQQAKSKGLKPENSPALKIAGEQHALARVAEEFDLEQIISEFRAVRGSVLQRWAAEGMSGSGRPAEISRFNESVDEALAASARHYASTHRSIVDTSADAIVGKTPAGIITSWNKGAERIFGYSAEEAIGQSTTILFPVENLNDELDILARIGRGEQVQNFDAVRVRKDGSQVHVSVTVSPITDKRGNVIGASKIARDITQRIEADTALRVSEERFRAMANSIPQLAWTARADGFIDWYNQRWYDYTGTTLAQMEGWDWQSVHDPEVLPRVMAAWKTALASGKPFEAEFPLRAADGSYRQFLTRAVPIKDDSGNVVRWAATNTDVDELKRSEVALKANQALLSKSNEDLKRAATENATIAEALKKTASENALIREALYIEKERAQVTLNSIGDAVICTDIDGSLNYINRAAVRLTQWTSAAALGRRLEEVFHIVDSDSRDVLPNVMSRAMEKNVISNLPPWCILIRPDGSELTIEDSCAPIHDFEGKVSGAVMVFRDVSEVRAMALKMSHLAQHDSLTDLPNRVLLNDRLVEAIALSLRNHRKLALLFLDLDGFKQINDSLGHVIGDQLLKSVSRRLFTCVRSSDTVSRYGGDEFVILLWEIGHADDAAALAGKILLALREPHIIKQHELHVTGSIGIVTYPDDGEDEQTLLKKADGAMYHAKEIGGDNYQFFSADMKSRAAESQVREGDLRRAI